MISRQLILGLILLSHSTIFAYYQPLKAFRSINILKHIISNLKMNTKSEDEWKSILSPNQFAVLRLKATEPPGFSERSPGELEYELKNNIGTKYPKEGKFECVACGTPLYTAKSKFDSGCGWPAFYEGFPGAIKEVPDADGRRIEIVCNNCGSHLGHVFKGEGFPTPTNERHCVNGICLKYNPEV